MHLLPRGGELGGCRTQVTTQAKCRLASAKLSNPSVGHLCPLPQKCWKKWKFYLNPECWIGNSQQCQELPRRYLRVLQPGRQRSNTATTATSTFQEIHNVLADNRIQTTNYCSVSTFSRDVRSRIWPLLLCRWRQQSRGSSYWGFSLCSLIQIISVRLSHYDFEQQQQPQQQ